MSKHDELETISDTDLAEVAGGVNVYHPTKGKLNAGEKRDFFRAVNHGTANKQAIVTGRSGDKVFSSRGKARQNYRQNQKA